MSDSPLLLSQVPAIQSGRMLPRITVVAVGCILLLSLSLRLEAPGERTFWGDEAWRAQQILHGASYSELLAGNYYGMEMPVQLGEYLLGKLGLALFGPSELAFRIWSLIGSLVFLLFALKIALALLSWPLVLLFLLLLGVSPGLIEHTHEFKPYIIEGALYLALLSLFLPSSSQFRQTHSSSLLSILYGKCCILGSVWIFTPVVPLYILCSFLKFPSRKAFLVLTLSGVIGFIGITSFLSFQERVGTRGVTDFWAPYAIDTSQKLKTAVLDTLPSTLDWYILHPFSELGLPLLIGSAFLLLFFFCGAGSLLLEPLTRSFGVVLFFPLPIMTGLSLLGEYPFFMRVSSFYYPALLVSALYGLEILTPKRAKDTLFVLILMLGIFAVWQGNFWSSSNPGVTRRYQNIRPLLDELKKRAVYPSQVYANYQARLAIAFYRPEWIFPETVQDYQTKKAGEHPPTCSRLFGSTKPPASEIWFLAIDRVSQYEHDKACCKENPSCTIITDTRQPLAYLLGFRIKE